MKNQKQFESYLKIWGACKCQFIDNIHCIKTGDSFIYNEQEIADLLNKYFANEAADLKEPTQLSDF